jgi:hypothetical protein
VSAWFMNDLTIRAYILSHHSLMIIGTFTPHEKIAGKITLCIRSDGGEHCAATRAFRQERPAPNQHVPSCCLDHGRSLYHRSCLCGKLALMMSSTTALNSHNMFSSELCGSRHGRYSGSSSWVDCVRLRRSHGFHYAKQVRFFHVGGFFGAWPLFFNTGANSFCSPKMRRNVLAFFSIPVCLYYFGGQL